MKHFLLVFLISGCIPALAQPWLHRDNSPELDSLSFFFFGDVMQHEPQISGAWNAETADYDYSALFSVHHSLLAKSRLCHRQSGNDFIRQGV